MNALTRFVVTLVLALMAAGMAFAQDAAVPVQRSSGGVEYVNGGIGDGARNAMSQMSGFDLKLVFSNPAGEYLVADHVAVKGPSGEVFAVDQAGPWLLLKLPPGSYTVSARYAGATQERAVKVGSGMRTMNWRFAAS
ncbi:MAG TPA: carboxypeptidase regulatory-like domain-containing protein [Caldimonas sp.]|nr:carboxypeptidase regulatory-like domain-containing protein [Caldimonas sp.]